MVNLITIIINIIDIVIHKIKNKIRIYECFFRGK